MPDPSETGSLRTELELPSGPSPRSFRVTSSTMLATSFAAQGAQISGQDEGSTLGNLAYRVSESARNIRVNRSTALAIGRRIEEIVAIIDSEMPVDSAVDSKSSTMLSKLKQSLNDFHDVINGQAARSYLSQLLHQQRDRDILLALEEKVKDTLRLTIMELKMQASSMAMTLSSQIDSIAANEMTAPALPETLHSEGVARIPPLQPLLFGRLVEIDAVVNTVTDAIPGRVAILGGPGIGKTSLSVAVLHQSAVVERFGARRFFVPCDSAQGNFLSTITACVGVVASSPNAIQHRLRTFLSDRPCLLVLDNFESVWEAVERRPEAEEVLQFLDAIDNLSLIVTLRGAERPNGIRWSRPFLEPLAPLSDVAARQIFLAIADVPATDTLLEKLISHLDNVPLALVLLASLAQFEPPETLLLRWNALSTAMLVRGEGRSRQTSLDSSIRLSLQSPRMQAIPEAQALLSALAVLPHGVVDMDLHSWRLAQSSQALSVLLQNSLATIDLDRRVRVLAPIRSFMLSHHPPSQAMIDPVFEHYFGLAELVNIGHSGGDWARVIPLVAPELGNIDSVIKYAFAHSRTVQHSAIQAVRCMCILYANHGIGSAPDLVPTALSRAEGEQLDKVRADLLLEWGRTANNALISGDPQSLYRQALDLYEHLGDIEGIIDSGAYLASFLPAGEAAIETERLYRLAETHKDLRRMVLCAHHHAAALERGGRMHDAIAQYELSISLAAQAPKSVRLDVLVGHSQHWKAVNMARLGDLRGALAMNQAALSTFEAISDSQGIAIVRSALATRFLDRGRTREAILHAEGVLHLQTEEDYRTHAVTMLVLADAYVWAGELESAAHTMARLQRLAPAGSLTAYHQSIILAVQGCLALSLGDLAEARGLLKQARAHARGRDPVQPVQALFSLESSCMQVMVEVEREDDNCGEAEVLAITAAVMRRQQGNPVQSAWSLVLLAEVVDDTFAELLLDAVQLPLYRWEMDRMRATTVLRRATISQQRGARELARIQARRALDLFGDFKDVWRIQRAQRILEDGCVEK